MIHQKGNGKNDKGVLHRHQNYAVHRPVYYFCSLLVVFVNHYFQSQHELQVNQDAEHHLNVVQELLPLDDALVHQILPHALFAPLLEILLQLYRQAQLISHIVEVVEFLLWISSPDYLHLLLERVLNVAVFPAVFDHLGLPEIHYFNLLRLIHHFYFAHVFFSASLLLLLPAL